MLIQQSADCFRHKCRKRWLSPFLVTNALRCSEIPHPGYKGRHGRVFFNFVGVDNELLHWATTASRCFFLESASCAALCVQADVSAHGSTSGLWICVLCRIVRSSGCECTWINEWVMDLCPVPHCAFKRM